MKGMFEMKKIFVSTIIATLITVEQNALADMKTGTSCEGKCDWTYDTITHDLVVEKRTIDLEGNVIGENEEVIIPSHFPYTVSVASNGFYGEKIINNMTIKEGITGAEAWAIEGYDCTTGTKEGTLTLPSTFKVKPEQLIGNGYQNPFYNIRFGTIDASALRDTEIQISTTLLDSIIIDETANVKINVAVPGGGTLNFQINCKGTDLTECHNQVIPVAQWNGQAMVLPQTKDGYYQGYDTRGHLIESWGPDGKKTYSYNYLANGDYRMYDADGKFLGSFMSDGSKRRIYTVSEAEAALGKTGKNTFLIRYR